MKTPVENAMVHIGALRAVEAVEFLDVDLATDALLFAVAARGVTNSRDRNDLEAFKLQIGQRMEALIRICIEDALKSGSPAVNAEKLRKLL